MAGTKRAEWKVIVRKNGKHVRRNHYHITEIRM